MPKATPTVNKQGMTRRGVCYELEKSPYKMLVYDKAIFYFSSVFYMEKFERENVQECKNFSHAVQPFLIPEFYLTALFLPLAVNWYAKIEKRGFLININGLIFRDLQSASFYLSRKIYDALNRGDAE